MHGISTLSVNPWSTNGSCCEKLYAAGWAKLACRKFAPAMKPEGKGGGWGLFSAGGAAPARNLHPEGRIFGIPGVGGAGKTTTLAVIREVSEQYGYEVRGLAPTSRAAQQLDKAGISSQTLQAELVRGRSQDRGSPRLYVIDEASLASTRQMRDFLGRLDSRDRVVLVGDTRQHQGVEAGRPFEQLQEHSMQTAKLDEIVRQRDPGLKQAVEHLARGHIAQAVDDLEAQGRVTEIQDRARRIETIASAYAEHPESTLVVAPDNASRRELNQRIHDELQNRGVVNGEDHTLSILVARQDLT